MPYKIVGLCFLVFGSSCCGKKLPSFIQKCKLDDTAINKCLIERVEALRPYLEKGIPEMQIPAIKPIRIPKAEVHTGNRTSAVFNAIFTDIVIDNAESFQVKKVNFDLKNKKTDLSIYIPKLRIRSTYKFDGNILVLHLSGTGPADANITDVNSESHSIPKIVTRDGKQYLDIGNDTPIVTYATPSVYFADLFNGHPELTAHTNHVINEHILEIMKEIKPLIDETIQKFVSGIIKNIFDNYSLDELFE